MRHKVEPGFTGWSWFPFNGYDVEALGVNMTRDRLTPIVVLEDIDKNHVTCKSLKNDQVFDTCRNFIKLTRREAGIRAMKLAVKLIRQMQIRVNHKRDILERGLQRAINDPRWAWWR